MEFDWDPKKAIANARKHNLMFRRKQRQSLETRWLLRLKTRITPWMKKDGLLLECYFEAYQKGTNLVLFSPDVARVFPAEEAVNGALRSLINVSQKSIGLTKPSTGCTRKLHAI